MEGKVRKGEALGEEEYNAMGGKRIWPRSGVSWGPKIVIPGSAGAGANPRWRKGHDRSLPGRR